jgi:hypothetical protein
VGDGDLLGSLSPSLDEYLLISHGVALIGSAVSTSDSAYSKPCRNQARPWAPASQKNRRFSESTPSS